MVIPVGLHPRCLKKMRLLAGANSLICLGMSMGLNRGGAALFLFTGNAHLDIAEIDVVAVVLEE